MALRSALQNLVSNAIKYGGDARWVRMSARATGQGSGEMVEFAVEDRGLGIHADERARIFEAFSRGRAATDRQIQGSGLGLNLVQRIATAHGGSVSVSSEPGRGSTFTLRLPAARGAAQGGAADAALDPPGNRTLMPVRVLLVEDEPGLQLVVGDRLIAEGYHVETAGDGDTALRRASGEPFDLIVLDVMLPGRNGFDVARTLREQGVRTPILMLTARSQVVDRVVGLRIGADDYLTKPFEMIELMARIEALLRRAPPESGVALERTSSATSRWTCGAPRSREVGRPSSSPRRSSSCSATSSSIAGRPSRATSCCTRSGATRPRRPRGPWTCTWRGCGRSSSPTRRPLSSSSPCTAWGTSSQGNTSGSGLYS